MAKARRPSVGLVVGAVAWGTISIGAAVLSDRGAALPGQRKVGYGTLFDFASAAAGCRDALGDKLDRLTTLWRNKQLQYTWLRAIQGRHADFWQVTGKPPFSRTARPGC